MAARWQQQEINTFTTVLSLQSIQFHGLCSDRPRSELKHECIKCAYMWSTQCCHIRSVDSLVFLDFLSYCEWFLAQMKEMQLQTLWAPVPLWRFRMHKSPRRFTFPFNIDQNIQPIGLLKITHSENTQRDDRCFSQPNTPKYIYCGVATLWGSEQCFSNVPAWTGARAWTGHSQLQALSAEQLFGIRCEPRVSMRGSANPTD